MNINYFRIIIIIVTILQSYEVFGQSSYLSFNEQVALNKIKSNNSIRNIYDRGKYGIEFEYEISGAYVKIKTIDKEVYHSLKIKGFGNSNVAGKPALPSRNEIIAAPINGNFTITIIATSSRIFKGYNIHPAREPAIETKEKSVISIDDLVKSTKSI